ncbi:hypothetical protein PCE1_000125 [Barthelona sp. PCE]
MINICMVWLIGLLLINSVGYAQTTGVVGALHSNKLHTDDLCEFLSFISDKRITIGADQMSKLTKVPNEEILLLVIPTILPVNWIPHWEFAHKHNIYAVQCESFHSLSNTPFNLLPSAAILTLPNERGPVGRCSGFECLHFSKFLYVPLKTNTIVLSDYAISFIYRNSEYTTFDSLPMFPFTGRTVINRTHNYFTDESKSRFTPLSGERPLFIKKTLSFIRGLNLDGMGVAEVLGSLPFMADRIKREAPSNQYIGHQQTAIMGGNQMDISHFTQDKMFDMMQALQKVQAYVKNGFHTYRPQPTELKAGLSIPQDSIFFINNIVTDMQYSGYATSWEQLNTNGYMRVLPQIRANVYNVISVINSRKGLCQFMNQVAELTHYRQPVRFGIMFGTPIDIREEWFQCIAAAKPEGILGMMRNWMMQGMQCEVMLKGRVPGTIRAAKKPLSAVQKQYKQVEKMNIESGFFVNGYKLDDIRQSYNVLLRQVSTIRRNAALHATYPEIVASLYTTVDVSYPILFQPKRVPIEIYNDLHSLKKGEVASKIEVIYCNQEFNVSDISVNAGFHIHCEGDAPLLIVNHLMDDANTYSTEQLNQILKIFNDEHPKPARSAYLSKPEERYTYQMFAVANDPKVVSAAAPFSIFLQADKVLYSKFPANSGFTPLLSVDPMTADGYRAMCLAVKLASHFGIEFRIGFVSTDVDVYNDFFMYAFEPAPVAIQLPERKLFSSKLVANPSWKCVAYFENSDLDNVFLTTNSSANGISVALIEWTVRAFVVEGSIADGEGGLLSGVPLYNLQNGKKYTTRSLNYKGYYQLETQPGLVNIKLNPKYEYNSRKFAPLVSDNHMFNRWSGPTIDLTVEITDHKTEKHVYAPRKQQTVNIFSIASGRLYERLLRVMIQSVLSQTKQPVHFFFLDEYLTSEMRNFLYTASEKLGFEITLVSYNWPSFMIRQHQKHRIMWAYKVLFLDVLFPEEVTRMIFVDADQVMRTDMHNLMTYDLKKNVYAMTAFCDTAPDMENFRFWKTGYWRSHLGNKPYHISALFLMDIIQLKQQASGHLREVYQSMAGSKDSLSNLDQDLLNYPQNQLKVGTLPSNWLWCESWCAEDEKSKANVIDLCNNPKTKRSKLKQAVDFIAEWPAYDEKATKLMKQYAAKPI